MIAAPPQHDLPAVVSRFQIYGDCVSAVPYGSGHINDTYCVTFDQAGTRVRYILQRLNHNVFRKPEVVMDNIRRVTTHLRSRSAREFQSTSRSCLQLVPCRDGQAWWRDPDGNHWRCYFFIEGAKTYDQVQNQAQAFHAAKAFGEFHRLLANLPGDPLEEPIPQFHDTRWRLENLLAAIERDPANRAAAVKTEIGFCLERRALVETLLQPERERRLPRRIVHGDTKLNNVMLDDRTGEAVCVIDLDTVMPGQVLHDFGDMCRTTTCQAAEDERDLSLVAPSMRMFEALARGYLSSFGALLNALERELLPVSASLVTFEIGIRFLEDYLAGDRYFKVKRPDHNLDRARSQFKLVREFELHQECMRALARRSFEQLDSAGALEAPPSAPC